MNDNQRKRQEFIDQLKTYQMMVSAWIAKIWRTPATDDFQESPDYQEALRFYREFQQKDDVKYGEVITYAKELYARHLEADKVLDEKADSIIKYLGGGTTLITFGALLSIKLDNTGSMVLGLVAILSVVPCLILAGAAVDHAIKARKPQGSALGPNVKFAVDIAEYNKTDERTSLNLWLMFYPICEAAFYRNLQKARHVDLAHKCYRRFMQALLLPVVGISVCLIVMIAIRATS